MDETPVNEIDIAPKSTVMQAARLFAEALAETTEFQDFEQSLLAFRQDEAVQAKIAEFRQKQTRLQTEIRQKAAVGEERQALQALADDVNRQPSVVRYAHAQAALVSRCQEVGDRLSEALNLDFASTCRTGGCCG